ncbi:MAG: hypothetical protein KGO00_05760 [Bacteroidetes bacterium]|nr:hypothetical protein [Bacteroidota bacterium]
MNKIISCKGYLIALGAFFAVLLFSTPSFSQNNPPDSAQISQNDSIQLPLPEAVAMERIDITRNYMTALGAWGLLNVVQGSISATNTVGPEHYFHQMSAYFNAVNVGIAAAGFLGIKKQLLKTNTLTSEIKAQRQIQKILLINSALDVGYFATGLILRNVGIKNLNPKTQGYGGSIMLQGAFLLVYDLLQYGAHHKNGKKLGQKIGVWSFGPTTTGMGLSYRF